MYFFTKKYLLWIHFLFLLQIMAPTVDSFKTRRGAQGPKKTSWKAFGTGPIPDYVIVWFWFLNNNCVLSLQLLIIFFLFQIQLSPSDLDNIYWVIVEVIDVFKDVCGIIKLRLLDGCSYTKDPVTLDSLKNFPPGVVNTLKYVVSWYLIE